MTTNEISSKIETLQELEELMEECKNEAEAIKDEIKSEMLKLDTEELEAGRFIIRFTSVLSSRFDTKRFKETFGEDVYKSFTKEVSSRRFTIA